MSHKSGVRLQSRLSSFVAAQKLKSRCWTDCCMAHKVKLRFNLDSYLRTTPNHIKLAFNLIRTSVKRGQEDENSVLICILMPAWCRKVSKVCYCCVDFGPVFEAYLMKQQKARQKTSRKAMEETTPESLQKIAAIFSLLTDLGCSQLTVEGVATLTACALVMATSILPSPASQVVTSIASILLI